jgi:16S rRNA (uracil1498-N3)-methyltransferase
MQRYFVRPEQMTDTTVTLAGEDARHFATVLRARPGDRFVACDGTGRDVLARAVRIEAGAVVAVVEAPLAAHAEPAWQVTVAQSLPKGDKLETVIQKGTEAGAVAFWPFVSRRTVVSYDGAKAARRVERWRKIAKEAAEQAHRSIVPEVSAICSWPELLARFASFDLVLFCYEEEGRRGAGLKTLLAERRDGLGNRPRILLVVGPEGGFDAEEAAEAAQAGAVWTGLGRRVLRTETAALVALACLAYESGEMGE